MINNNTELVEANFKRIPQVCMVDQSTSSAAFTTVTTNVGSQLPINSDNLKAECKLKIKLVSNDRDIPDFLAASDEEEIDIFSGQQAIVCSR